MTIQKKIHNSAPVVDEGWWASVLTDEGRYSGVAQQVRAMGNKSKVEQEAREKADDDGKTPINWSRVKDLYMHDQIVELQVTGHNRGGLLVEGEDMNGFVPISHLVGVAGKHENTDHDLEAFVGQRLHLKVIECVPEDRRVVFSERAAQSEPGKREELFHSLHPNQRIRGTVTNITDFGVFLDLGGVEGLIHISELSWGRVSHPSSIFKVGDVIDVLVLDLAPERCRVALSYKRLQPNPWLNADTEFPVGSVLPATITSVLSFGAFARLDAGVEGLIHATEISLPQEKSMREFLTEGERVQVRVLHVDVTHQRMGLSMKVDS